MTMYFSFPSRRCCHFAEWRMKAGENPMSNRVMRTKVKKHDNYELRKGKPYEQPYSNSYNG